MADFAALPFFTDAYLADTDHLTFEEHGVYLRLLMLMWRTPHCRLPNDFKWISRRLRCDEDIFAKLVQPIIEEFCSSSGNWITQKRLSKEFEYVQSRRKQQSGRAKSRWEKGKDTCGNDATPHTSGNATPHRSGNAPSPSPSPSPTKERLLLDLELEEGKPTPAESMAADFDEWWEGVWRLVGKGQAEKAYRTARKSATAIELLDGRDRYREKLKREETKTRYQAHPSTWLNGKRWLDEETPEQVNGEEYHSEWAALAPDAEHIRHQWQLRMGGLRDRKIWLSDWGPKPTEDHCRVPADVLAEFGFEGGEQA